MRQNTLHLAVFFCLAAGAGCEKPAPPPHTPIDKNVERVRLQKEYAAEIGSLLNGVAKSTELFMYAGLPPPSLGVDLSPEQLDEVRKTHEIVEFNGYWFYLPPVTAKLEDQNQLLSVCSSTASYRPWTGFKLCGGFHPDWCLEWKEGEVVRHILICFGCGEARVYGPSSQAWCDLPKEAEVKLREILIRATGPHPPPGAAQ